MSGSATGESSSFSYSKFTTVKPKKKRKGRKERVPPFVSFQLVRDEIAKEEWFTQCQHTLEDALSAISFKSQEALCLGLGSPSSSANASAQLAFLIGMSDHLKVDRSKVSVYDPVFTADDLLIFDGLKIRVLTENRNGEYPLDTPTFCFMPHCDMDLYESLLRANWAPERLCNLFLVANHLNDYLDSNPTHTLETRVPCLLRLAPLLEFKQLPASKSRQTAFNNTSAQYLSSRAPLLEEWFTEESKSKSPALSETE